VGNAVTVQDIGKRFITDVVALLEQLALDALNLCGYGSFLGVRGTGFSTYTHQNLLQ
jgi:hypothetical protein